MQYIKKYFFQTIKLVICFTFIFANFFQITNADGESCNQIYSDVDSTNQFCNSIEYLYHQNVLSQDDECLNPSKPLTRGEVAKMIVLAFNFDIQDSTIEFNDIQWGDEYAKYIDTLAYHKIINGYSDGSFRPYAFVTRGMLMKFAVRATKTKYPNLFPDYNYTNRSFLDLDENNVFEQDILNMYNTTFINSQRQFERIVDGFSDHTFRPDNFVTNEQISKVLLNLMKYSQQSNVSCTDYYCGDKFSGSLMNENLINNKIETLGYSVNGNPIYAHHFGSGCKTIIFTGSFHGDESNSTALMYKWVDELSNNSEKIPKNLHIIVIPSVNPDGVNSNLRLNANQVDLNRNFDSKWQQVTYLQDIEFPNGGGVAPFSEPESKVLQKLTVEKFPVLVVNYHSKAGYAVANSASFAKELAQQYASTSGYEYTGDKVNNGFDYTITGSYDGWLADLNIPSLVIELETFENDEFEMNREAMWEVMNYFGN